MLDRIEIQLRGRDGLLPIYFEVYDNSLSRKWLPAFENILNEGLHLEKNYCFFGFPDGPRNLDFLASEINRTIAAINGSSINYIIRDHFTVANMTVIEYSPRAEQNITTLNHDKLL